ncbi:MAG: Ig-like domain-containing protein [Treponema sp.]|nr:Ig-like domain-containing protein [Treponema sp.]
MQVTVGTGKQKKLTAAVRPSDATNQSVTWKTDNRSVATVSSGGRVTGVSAGTATIT